MQTIIECVPNFSEGRDPETVDAIISAMAAVPEVHILDRHMDYDHNRSVVTLIGSRESVGEAALSGIAKAAGLIDLTRHEGAHPCIGAADVVPFVPVSAVTMDDCVQIAARVAAETWRRFKIPTYLYGEAARTPERANLENIRRRRFEGLLEDVQVDSSRWPDFGEAMLHPTAGATAVGARKFLVAFNVNLTTPDVTAARQIATKIRASGGGLPHVKAMGVELKSRKFAQVSMNLTDFEATPMSVVFDTVAQQAAALGVGLAGSEIVGLVPRRALSDADAARWKVENFSHARIFEDRLQAILRDINPSS